MISPRQLAAKLYYKLTAALPSPDPQGYGRPVIVGFLRSASGVGETARLMYNGFRDLGFCPGYIDLSHRFHPSAMLDQFKHQEENSAGHGPLIIHANPPDMTAIMSFLGKGRLADRHIIGYWAWELEVMPNSWKKADRYIHEIWVPSKFTANAFQGQTKKNVRVVPPPLVRPAVEPNRSKFGIPSDAFTVLVVADSRSSLERKNVLGAITAFKLARNLEHKRERSWRLILKISAINFLKPGIRRELSKHTNDSDIQILETMLTEADMACLMNSADVLLSLHRSEGFGLVPAQALLYGKPIIATDWSGCKDFLNAENSVLVPSSLIPVHDPSQIYRSGHWADPDIEFAAQKISRLAGDKQMRNRMSAKAVSSAKQFFDSQRWRKSLGPNFVRRLAK